MNQKIFSVYDIAAASFQKPFFAGQAGEAMRSFCDICADDKHPLGQHPEDYTLMEVGVWDDQSGEILDIVSQKVITGVEAALIGREGASSLETDVGGTVIG